MDPYSGIRIVDFSQGVAGPMAAMLLADFGAEVVKVESSEGDPIRCEPGYLAFNRNKTVVTLDLEDPKDRTVADKLIAGADVVLFDFSPSRMTALKLDFSSLLAAHPALIHAWMPAYGTTGRFSELPASHSLLAALTGMAFHQQAYGDGPVHPVIPILWYTQAVLGASAIGAALYQRDSGGAGQAVEVTGLNAASQAGMIARRAGAPLPARYRPGQNIRYRLYQCADGQWLFLGALFEPFYRRALAVLGVEDEFAALESDPDAGGRRLAGIFSTRPRDEWLTALGANDVPCATIESREAWFSGTVIAEAGLRVRLDHPVLGHVDMPAPPVRLSATPASIRHLPRSAVTLPHWEQRASVGRNTSPTAPLAGIRVLNLGAVVAGAYTGALLASLGADVVKVESREGDGWRSDGAGFLGINRGTRGLGLDLKQPAAQELFLELAQSVDVVIDNFRLGVRARLGIDYAALAAVNPAIISCSITGYGDVGARSKRPAFDPLLQAEGGMMAAQGDEQEPVVQTISVNDTAAAGAATMAVIAALNARIRTGKGQDIMTSLMSQSLFFQLAELVEYADRPPADRGGVDCIGVRALTRFYACNDGWIGLDCTNPAQVDDLADILGLDLDPSTLMAPRDGKAAGAIATAIAGRGRTELLEAFFSAAVPAAPVLCGEDVWASNWLCENEFVEPWRHPRLGVVMSPPGYARFPMTLSEPMRPTPDLAEHTTQILSDWGIAEGRIAELLAAGAVFASGSAQ